MKLWNSIGQYAKGVVAVAGAVITGLAPYYGSQQWFPALTGGIAAVTTILVANQPKN